MQSKIRTPMFAYLMCYDEQNCVLSYYESSLKLKRIKIHRAERLLAAQLVNQVFQRCFEIRKETTYIYIINKNASSIWKAKQRFLIRKLLAEIALDYL